MRTCAWEWLRGSPIPQNLTRTGTQSLQSTSCRPTQQSPTLTAMIKWGSQTSAVTFHLKLIWTFSVKSKSRISLRTVQNVLQPQNFPKGVLVAFLPLKQCDSKHLITAIITNCLTITTLAFISIYSVLVGAFQVIFGVMAAVYHGQVGCLFQGQRIRSCKHANSTRKGPGWNQIDRLLAVLSTYL